MDLQLRGKRALVTGSSCGIGESIVKVLASEGVSTIVHGRNEEEANRVAEEITKDGGKAVVVIADLATDDGAKHLAENALSALGNIDILVNNIGIFPFRGLMDTTPDKWAEIYNINVISMVRMIQLLVPQMKKLGWGRIVQMSSIAGASPSPSLADYCATKAAIANMTVSLTKEVAETGITVNTVSPGLIMTPGWDRLALQVGEAMEWGTNLNQIKHNLLHGLAKNPSGRLGEVEDVANLVAFLVSPLAGFINGANIRIDGGQISTVN
jgi:3-oxoacyl-[acyl-carrier protein] reductase